MTLMENATTAKFLRPWFYVCTYQAVKTTAGCKPIFHFSVIHPGSTIFHAVLIQAFRLLIN